MPPLLGWMSSRPERSELKVVTLYESFTGNTAFAVEAASRVLAGLGHEPERLRYRDTDPGHLPDADLYCFAFPVHGFAPPVNVWAFLGALGPLDGAPVFIMTTNSGWPGIAHVMAAQELRRSGAVVLGDHSLVCEDSYPITRAWFGRLAVGPRYPTPRGVFKLVDFAVETAGRAQACRSGLHVKLPEYRLWPFGTLPVGLLARGGFLRHGMGKRSLDEDACDGCGTCAAVCPGSAIELDPLPVVGPGCIGCWACLNRCPRNALLTSLVRPEHYYAGLREKELRLSEAGLGKGV
jgi:NAD-dependent dihydropyrimidine dehydrogenase PreA subunit